MSFLDSKLDKAYRLSKGNFLVTFDDVLYTVNYNKYTFLSAVGETKLEEVSYMSSKIDFNTKPMKKPKIKLSYTAGDKDIYAGYIINPIDPSFKF